jgi:hypothetical protein
VSGVILRQIKAILVLVDHCDESVQDTHAHLADTVGVHGICIPGVALEQVGHGLLL